MGAAGTVMGGDCTDRPAGHGIRVVRRGPVACTYAVRRDDATEHRRGRGAHPRLAARPRSRPARPVRRARRRADHRADRTGAPGGIASIARRWSSATACERSRATGTWPTTASGYMAYVDRFGGDLQGVEKRIPHLSELGVDVLHLLSLLHAPRGRERRRLRHPRLPQARPAARHRGRSLGPDRVAPRRRHQPVRRLRAQPHEQRPRMGARPPAPVPTTTATSTSRSPTAPSPTPTRPTLPEIFPDMSPGNFTWIEPMERWVWTTFREFQWDLNWANPDVMVEVCELAFHLANLGVDVLRLDAIAFTWKRLGTNCQNQPEAHLVAQALRAVLAIAAPATILLAEAIVGPNDLVGYLGRHSAERRECELAYHNQLMVQGWSMLATRRANLARGRARPAARAARPHHVVHLRALPRRHRLGDRRCRRRRRGRHRLRAPRVPRALLPRRLLRLVRTRHRVRHEPRDARRAHLWHGVDPHRRRRRARGRRRRRSSTPRCGACCCCTRSRSGTAASRSSTWATSCAWPTTRRTSPTRCCRPTRAGATGPASTTPSPPAGSPPAPSSSACGTASVPSSTPAVAPCRCTAAASSRPVDVGHQSVFAWYRDHPRYGELLGVANVGDAAASSHPRRCSARAPSASPICSTPPPRRSGRSIRCRCDGSRTTAGFATIPG